MTNRASLPAFFLLLLSSSVSAQTFGLPGSNSPTFSTPYRQPQQPIDVNQNLWLLNGRDRSPLEGASGSLSKLDLKAPGKARREYDKGYQLLQRKDLQGAIEHLTTAISIYSTYVSAHNALGSAYLGLHKNDEARAEFAAAVALDDHLPTSYLNLGCAELALSRFSAAQEAIQKASSIAPLDLELLTALVYGQYMNHEYGSAVETARRVHERKHDGAAMVHFFAAAAWAAQDNVPQAQKELLTFLREDPKSPAALQAVQIMEDMKRDQEHPSAVAALNVSITAASASIPSVPVALPQRVQKLLQDAKESGQIAEAEAEAECPTCAPDESAAEAEVTAGSVPRRSVSSAAYPGFILHSSTDEVAVFFAATDHGRSVTNLTANDVKLHDNSNPPAVVTGFRSESELPLRLGLVIDTSASVRDRFNFEQQAANNFMQKVMTGQNDLAFVIGFANSVLLVQDFTNDQKLISHSVGELVASGGTHLWDAVAFAADKLASRPESQPVARALVVISDGEDNSSSDTLKQAIRSALRGEVAVYTVSTKDVLDEPDKNVVGERALTALAELSGGAAFSPGSIHNLNGSLAALQQVIRSRYLISYKPAFFQRDGKYHAIDLKAEKDGHELRVYARKGYYESTGSHNGPDRF
jgi:VWFA-related protein